MSKVRIINEKTGEVRMVTPMVAEQTKLLRNHGWKIQDLKKSEELEPQKIVPPVVSLTPVTNEESLFEEEEDLLESEGGVEELDGSNETTSEGPKRRGRKPKVKTEENI